MHVFRSHVTSFIAATLFVAFVAMPAEGQAPMKVGEHFTVRIDSSDPAVSDVESVDTATGRVYEINHSGATYIAIHFESFNLAPGDSVVVSDPWGGQSYTLNGKGKRDAETFWSQHIKGDTAVVELITTGQKRGRGFVIDEYAAGNASFTGTGDFEAICGSDDKLNAVCYASSHPTEYDRSRAVARLLISGSSLCTGWLASGTNHLITNEHCISTSTAAADTDYEFGAEAPNCSDSNCQLCFPGEVFSGATFIQDSADLDYALVQIDTGNPAGTYGFLQIDNRTAVVGEEIYIPQHAGGDAKELGIESSDSADAGGVCHVTTFDSGCSSSNYSDVGYQCDTEGGSSGSPVIARSSHKVIALHHCANCPNRGVPIELVCAEVCGFLGPECTVNADCDDSNACTSDSCVSESCVHDPIANCCGNGTCESGEDCNNCSGDCFTGSGASCGNGVCETADGEDCQNCSADCNGVTGGRPSSRYCCGSDVDCSDSRCTGSGNTCSSTPTVGSCCGDGTCEGSEDETNCAVDCSVVGCTIDSDCDDADACTTDVCSGGTCSNTAINCDDGDACTTDSCSGGSCFNDPISCDDGDTCTTDSCDVITGCSNVSINCDDGDACTTDSCSGGSCFNDPISCDDGDSCTTDSCDPGSGCVNTAPPCQDGDGCCPAGCDNTNDNDCVTCVPAGGFCSSGADCCSGSCHPVRNYCR